jgi:septal ring factor EnvC (AmiA/AmiB activator)
MCAKRLKACLLLSVCFLLASLPVWSDDGYWITNEELTQLENLLTMQDTELIRLATDLTTLQNESKELQATIAELQISLSAYETAKKIKIIVAAVVGFAAGAFLGSLVDR